MDPMAISPLSAQLVNLSQEAYFHLLLVVVSALFSHDLLSNSSRSNNLFCNTGSFSSGAPQTQQPVGTTIKFVAPTSQDSINRNGAQTTINTNHQCVTAMKEYESKSLEELRFEDYQANRKFPQTQSQFSSSNIFSTTGSTSSGFGGSNLFGSTTTQANRSLFGNNTTATTPAQPQTTSLFGQTTQTNPANRPFFGTSTTGTTATGTTGFAGFGTQPATQVLQISIMNGFFIMNNSIGK